MVASSEDVPTLSRASGVFEPLSFGAIRRQSHFKMAPVAALVAMLAYLAR